VPKFPYGFRCRSFSVALSSNGLVVPGESDQPLRQSMVPVETSHDMAGHYTLRVRSAGELICDLPVVVVWVLHRSQTEPFLGIRPDEPSDLRAALSVYEGRPVELDFLPR
jgi:hypothetical protein